MSAENNKKIVFLDVKSTDLNGEVFYVFAVSFDQREYKHVRWRPTQTYSQYVKDNDLPVIDHIPVTHDSRAEALRDFAEWWCRLKDEGYTICTHMSHAVEIRFMLDLYAENNDILGTFDGSYPIFDTSSMLHVLGFQSDSEEAFLRKQLPGYVERLELHFSPHDSRFKFYVAARTYELLTSIATTKNT